MTEQDILLLRDLAEAGQVQFKERIVSKDDKYEIGCEMVTFSNSRGGRLIIGINDKEITHSANEFVITIPRIMVLYNNLNIKVTVRIYGNAINERYTNKENMIKSRTLFWYAIEYIPNKTNYTE